MRVLRRSGGPSRRQDSSLNQRQVNDFGDGFTIRVETVAGGQLVTLTHAIIGPAETLPPNDSPATSEAPPAAPAEPSEPSIPSAPSVPSVPSVPSAPAVSSAPSAEPEVIATSAEAPSSEIPVSSSQVQEEPFAETEAAFTSEALILSSTGVPTSEASTLTTSILPDSFSATDIVPIATGEVQASQDGDADRLPAVGITIGALGGAGMVIGAGVMLYRYKHRRAVRVKSGEKRQFQEI